MCWCVLWLNCICALYMCECVCVRVYVDKMYVTLYKTFIFRFSSFSHNLLRSLTLIQAHTNAWNITSKKKKNIYDFPIHIYVWFKTNCYVCVYILYFHLIHNSFKFYLRSCCCAVVIQLWQIWKFSYSKPLLISCLMFEHKILAQTIFFTLSYTHTHTHSYLDTFFESHFQHLIKIWSDFSFCVYLVLLLLLFSCAFLILHFLLFVLYILRRDFSFLKHTHK